MHRICVHIEPNNSHQPMTATTRYHLATIMWLALAAVCGVVLTLAGIYLYLSPQLPPAENYREVRLETPLRVYSDDGALLAEFGERRSIPLSFEEIPKDFINALLDTEDKRFYEHSGIDYISLANDSVQLLLNRGEIKSGASTITMQLSRNISFSLEQTFIRKFKEMLLALKIEQALTKDEILALYINAVPYGKRAYGAQAAAYTYYGKPLAELSLAQLAMLAGIPQAPSAGNPVNGPKRALRRRNLVLSRMLEQGSITPAQHTQATAEPMEARVYERELDVPAPYVAEWVRRQLIGSYPDLYTAGYEVHTTIKSNLQLSATKSLRKGLMAYDEKHGYRGPEVNLLTTNPDTTEAQNSATANNALIELATTTLAKTKVVGELQPAVVLAVDANQAVALLASGEQLSLPMAAMEWARPYESVNVRGPAPTEPSAVVKVGDLIRVIPGTLAQELREPEPPEEGVKPAEPLPWVLSQIPKVQGALISLDPNTGAVVALEGGFDFGLSQFNHALQAARQPGSSFKPFVYSAALSNNVTPASIFMDAPLVFEDDALETQYRPNNDNKRYNGPTRLREALYRSINLVSIRVMLKIGARAVLNHIKGFGFDTRDFPKSTQLAIGGGKMAVTPLQNARAYAVFANGGYRVEPYVVDRVIDSRGKLLQSAIPMRICSECEALKQDQSNNQNNNQKDDNELPSHCPGQEQTATTTNASEIAEPNESTIQDSNQADASKEIFTATAEQQPQFVCANRVLDARNAYITNTMLRDVVQRGTGRRARVLERADLGGKTGTTNDAADTWFNGFSQDLVSTVWVGFSNFDPLGARAYGSNTPLPIWVDYMRTALAEQEARPLAQPPGVVVVKIDPETGEAATPGQPGTIFEYFYADNAPEVQTQNTSQPRNESGTDFKPIDIF